MRLHWSIPVAAASAIVTAAIWFSIPGHADPGIQPGQVSADYICTAIDEHPTFDGINRLTAQLMRAGTLTAAQAADAILLAAELNCPRWLPLLMRFADSNTPQNTGGVTV